MGQDSGIKTADGPCRCVFCGNPKLATSKIWPNWLDRMFPEAGAPPAGNGDGSPTGMEGGSLPPHILADLSRPITQRPRLACAECNNGWITGLGDRVRSFMVPALEGGQVDLSPDQLRALSGVLCLMAMTTAYLTRHCGISAGDRAYLRHTGQPPKNWSIFAAGLSEAGWQRACKHRPYRIEFSGNPLTTHSKGRNFKEYNTQLLTIGIGRMFFHLISTPSLPLLNEFNATSRAQGLTQIWPLPRRFGLLPLRHVRLPGNRRLTDLEAGAIADRFASRLPREAADQQRFDTAA